MESDQWTILQKMGFVDDEMDAFSLIAYIETLQMEAEDARNAPAP